MSRKDIEGYELPSNRERVDCSTASESELNDVLACPCGKHPLELCITEKLSGKWIDITSDCCGEWTIEARNNYATGKDMIENAKQAWNDAPRAS